MAVPLAAALSAALLLVGVGAVALHEANQAITRDALARVESNRDSAIRAVERQSTDLKRTIEAFAADPAIIAASAHPTSATLAAAKAQMSLMARSKGAPAVVLTDLTGRTLISHPFVPEVVGQDFSYRDWFTGAKRTGKPYVSAAYRSVAPGAPLAVGIATPITDRGKRVGYLTVVGQLDAVRAVAEGAHQDDGVVITVTDQTGQRLTQKLPVDDRGEPLTASVDRGTEAALAGLSSSIVNEDDLAASGPVPGVGWTVTASLPLSVALAPGTAFRDSLGLTLGAALLLLAISTLLVVRAVRRRVAEHDQVEVERVRLTTLFADSPIGIVECNADGLILTVNDALSAMLGYATDELVGTRAKDLLEIDKIPAADRDIAAVLSGELERYTRERVYLAKDGTLVPALTSVIVVREPHHAVRRVVSFIVDQRQQKRIEDALRASEDRLKELALHDDLTGLANRRLLLDRCREAIDAARVGGVDQTSVAALFIDLDGFKPVNDLQGHERGDQLLVEIATDLLAVVRPTDTVARVGGDEFVILLSPYEGVEHLHATAARVTRAVRREVTDGRSQLSVTASVGVAAIDLAVEPSARPDQLFGRADAAMYSAKQRGRDRHDMYQPSPHFRDGTVEVPESRSVLY